MLTVPSCDSFSRSSAKGSWLKPILERITCQHKGAPGPSTKMCGSWINTWINTWINFRDWQDWQDLKVKDWKSKGMVRFGGWKDWKGQGIRKDQSENPDETSSHLVIDSWNKRLAICQHLPCSWPPYRSHPQELIFYTFLPPNLPKNHRTKPIRVYEAVTNSR